MKGLIFGIVFLILIFSSCRKQDNISIEKLYIVEYDYEFNEDNRDSLSPSFKFKMIGFSELDKDLNLKYARRLTWDSYFFYDLSTIIPDSMNRIVLKAVNNYQRDTSFLYRGEIGSRIYDGNAYRLIIQYSQEKMVTIKFEPRFLPDDLKQAYEYLYEDRQKTEHQSKYNDQIELFDSLIYKELPPHPIRNSVKFVSPKIMKDDD